MVETILNDVRYAARLLRRSPAFALVAVVLLAVAVGANTAVFSVVEGVLLRPLPYAEPERLVAVWETNDKAGPEFRNRTEVAEANLLDWSQRNRSFEQLAALAYANASLVGRAQPERLRGALVTPNFFETLGVPPAVGRAFEPADGVPNAAPVAVLSDGVWRRAFGADPGVVGSQVTLSGRAVTIAGVMPAGFDLPFPTTMAIDVWLPLALDPATADRQAHYLYTVGRLREGVSVEVAEAEMGAIAGRLGAEHPDTNTGRAVHLVPLHTQIVGDVQTPLALLFAAVAAVLLVACGNVANLLLARAARRRREIAIRAALGAGRFRIVRQLLTESLVLAAGGGTLGLLFASWSIDLLRALGPTDVPLLKDVGVRWPVFLFALGASLATALAFGLGPALRSTGIDLVAAFKSNDRAAGSRTHDRTRGALVVAEVAVTIVMLVGAGLLVRSFVRLLDVNPGFDPKGVLTLNVALPRARYAEPERSTAFAREALGRIAAIPGVEAVGTIDPLPLSGRDNTTTITIVGQPVPPPAERPEVAFRTVSPGYVETMRIPLLAGRTFAEDDVAPAPRVAVVNEAFARRYWPDGAAVGQAIAVPDGNGDSAALGPAYEVVGVVGNVHHTALDAEPKPEFYLCYFQDPNRFLSVVVRSAIPPDRLSASVRDAIRSTDPDQPVHEVMTMEQRVAETVAKRRFAMLLAAVFAAVALLIASVGLYGVLSYFVEQREREIGVRMALGARRGDVLRLVFGRGLGYALAGLALGSLAAAALSHAIASQLFGVDPVDPATYASIDTLVLAVAAAATLIPALRATAVDPAVALRGE